MYMNRIPNAVTECKIPSLSRSVYHYFGHVHINGQYYQYSLLPFVSYFVLRINKTSWASLFVLIDTEQLLSSNYDLLKNIMPRK